MDKLTKKVLIFLLKWRISKNGNIHRFLNPNCKKCKEERDLLKEVEEN